MGDPRMLPSPMHPLHPRPHPAAPPGGARSEGAPMEPPSPHPGPAPLVQRGRGRVRTRPSVAGPAPLPVQTRSIRPPKIGEDPGVQKSPPNSGSILRFGPPPAPSWGPRQAWGGGFGSARVFPSRAEAPEGCQEVFGYFRLHSGVSASLGYFRLYSESRRSGRRSALPAVLGGKYRRKLRVTPSWRRKHSKSVTAASRTSPGRAEAVRGGVSGVSGAAAEMAEGRRRPPCWEPRGAEAAAAA
ncbi:translation initiation factor IF-2-like [Pyrgilauda ruficollis]|uniref:translation initiation factor IF-2-like n=1 Tax=Pyrgilauda ruficollis TaxID=221976 RepID=UPI001B87C872|nr:translation initiation factor IF-2-like [Pyrgilauda ruficollis]